MTKGVRRDVVIKPDLPKPPAERPMPNPSDTKVRGQEQMVRRMAEQNRLLMNRLEKQQSDINRMGEAIEQLSKAVRELKQESKEGDKNQ